MTKSRTSITKMRQTNMINEKKREIRLMTKVKISAIMRRMLKTQSKVVVTIKELIIIIKIKELTTRMTIATVAVIAMKIKNTTKITKTITVTIIPTITMITDLIIAQDTIDTKTKTTMMEGMIMRLVMIIKITIVMRALITIN